MNTASYQPAKLNVYVTFSVSPLTTERSPGDWKSAAENSVPEVPDAAEHRKAPPTVWVALMENEAGLALLVTTDGLALVAAANVAAGRLPAYGVTSVQPACEDSVSVAAGVLEAPAPYRPMYQVVIWATEVKAVPAM